MSNAKQTQARLIDQRARRRATQALIERHPEEWRDLFEEALREARNEAEQLVVRAAKVITHVHVERTDPEPPRIMTGRRKVGESAVDRIDVARCPECISYHDAGHTCGRCGSPPVNDTPLPRNKLDHAVLGATRRGRTIAQIAFDLGITEEAVASRQRYLKIDTQQGARHA